MPSGVNRLLDWMKGSVALQQSLAPLSESNALLFEQLWESPKALLLARWVQDSGRAVLWIGCEQGLSRLAEDFRTLGVPCHEIPAWETLPSEKVAPSPDLVGLRMRALRDLASSSSPGIVLCPLQSVLQKVLPPEEMRRLCLDLVREQNFPFEDLPLRLQQMGYRRVSVVSDKGEFAVRGGILDVFPVAAPDPYRLEFFGDELTEIRLFDVATQKSRSVVERLEITPGEEWQLVDSAERLATVMEYLPADSLVVLDDLLALEDRYVSLKSMPGAFSRSFQTIEQFLEKASSHQFVFFADRPIDQLSDIKLRSKGSRTVAQFESFGLRLEAERMAHPFSRVADFFPIDADCQLPPALALVQSIGLTAPQIGMETIWLCPQEHEERQLRSWMDDLGLTLGARAIIGLGDLSDGFVVPAEQIAVVPHVELTHRAKVRRQHLRSAYSAPMLDFHELKPGDVVVHFHQGIGKFRGVEQKVNHQGEPAEFLVLEYAEGATLFVPAHQAHLVSRYVGMQEQAPSFHQLGGHKWKRQREATEKAIAGYAQQLLELYAAREVRGGYACREDSHEMLEFEHAFPYQETEDQQLAITAVKQDMMTAKPMDRLVCGDVGYGKTEVAMRAAFKAVVDGGLQVAVLVPTTVLALQHYESFVERMEGSPVRIACLSRMQTPKQQKKILEQISSGAIDIVIGTHRIVSKDVQFKNLGLLIIDEEQRFGVKAKEHLRQMRVGVDTLTLSATPIPRTLHFSMLGARDLSIIATPPQDRLPIKTIVCEEDDAIIQAALVREFARDGQAYYIHNRVETIYSTASRLQKLIPQGRLAIAHGQMDADAMDEVFHRFKSGEANLLVATSIVENGLDIPRANTIIIERADLFGLAELYQLRGRVGRWNRKAYAYLMTPKNRRLPEIAQQRLEALLTNSGQGGGLKVAMRDLEIRGAGDILGVEQSGHISTIGYHLYTKLLKRTIDALSGKLSGLWGDAKVELPVDARLPADYVAEPGLRMEFYQRFGEAEDVAMVDDLMRELKDRFGTPPLQAAWLACVSKLRILASHSGIQSVKWERGTLQVDRRQGENIKSTTQRIALSWDDPEHSLQVLSTALRQSPSQDPSAAGPEAKKLAQRALGKLQGS
jgi:transcription-repair coupling factor (superfamily II helicase)